MTLAGSVPAHHKRPVGLEAIILYKLIKAVLETLLGLLAIGLLTRGAEAGAATFAEIILEHVEHGWAIKAATLIVSAGTSGHVTFVAAAAFADAALSAVEGLALRAERWWAPWLVVIATAAILPVELWEIVRRPRWSRVILLVVSLAVVAYLLRNVVREHRAKKLARGVHASG